MQNLTPADVYFGKGQTILLERERIQRENVWRQCSRSADGGWKRLGSRIPPKPVLSADQSKYHDRDDDELPKWASSATNKSPDPGESGLEGDNTGDGVGWGRPPGTRQRHYL